MTVKVMKPRRAARWKGKGRDFAGDAFSINIGHQVAKSYSIIKNTYLKRIVGFCPRLMNPYSSAVRTIYCFCMNAAPRVFGIGSIFFDTRHRHILPKVDTIDDHSEA